MREYHKIQTIFKRDPETKFKTLLSGQYSTPELEYLALCQWQFTEKVDGTNIRIMWDGKSLTYGGRTDRAQIPATLVTALNDKFLPLTDYFAEFFSDGVCLYGEGYGTKIQKAGANYRPDQGFVLFDVRVGDWWLRRESVESIAHDMGVDVVPVIGEGTLLEAVEWAQQGIPSTWGDFQAEGIVARPATELSTRDGKRIITKIKCRDFQ